MLCLFYTIFSICIYVYYMCMHIQCHTYIHTVHKAGINLIGLDYVSDLTIGKAWCIQNHFAVGSSFAS